MRIERGEEREGETTEEHGNADEDEVDDILKFHVENLPTLLNKSFMNIININIFCSTWKQPAPSDFSAGPTNIWYSI